MDNMAVNTRSGRGVGFPFREVYTIIARAKVCQSGDIDSIEPNVVCVHSVEAAIFIPFVAKGHPL